MGQAARVWVSQNYSSEKVLAENIEFYRGLLRLNENLSGANLNPSESAPDQLLVSTSEP
jgi:hypothetical protein